MVIEQDDQMNFEPFTAQNQGVSEVAAHCVRKSTVDKGVFVCYT